MDMNNTKNIYYYMKNNINSKMLPSEWEMWHSTKNIIFFQKNCIMTYT